MTFSLVIHGHFYQPPRENPWTDYVERESSAAPFHDWNARIHSECYRANAFARIHDRTGHIQSVVNNYGRLSFNFGPTLARWIERNDARTHARLLAADGDQHRRLGAGGAMAQAYAHPIVPLCAPMDRRTQLLWGLADFRRRFGRPADGLWLPETAASAASLADLIDMGVRYTILAPEQIAAVREPGEEWTSVDRDTVDTGRAYRWLHPDQSGRYLTVAVFDGPMSRGVAFGEATRDAGTFLGMARASAKRSRVSEPPLVLCASDGELYGHHKKFADLNLAFTSFVEGPRQGIEPTNLEAYLRTHPPTWDMALAEGPDGKGTSWSCAHGVGRWWRDCGCTMAPQGRPWNHRWRTPLREAMDVLQGAAADFFEDAAAALLVDPWGARDAYGEVVDASVRERDGLLAGFGTPALSTGGEEARRRARLLMEMQRATLLMFASCGWYFDDIAGLEASLVLRLAAHAADLMNEAGGSAPVEEMLDILATAKSNEGTGETGADVFRLGAADRVTPQRAVAAVALALAASPGASPALPADELTPGHDVQVVSQSTPQDQRWHVSGQRRGVAAVTDQRLGGTDVLEFSVRWEAARGFRVHVDGADVAVRELSRESRHRLFPLLMPQIMVASDEAPLAAARLALELGRGVVGGLDAPEDVALRRGYAQLLVKILETRAAAHQEVALRLLDAAGAQLSPGTPERAIVEELVAERLGAASVTESEALTPLAIRLGFAIPSGDSPAVASPPGAPSPGQHPDSVENAGSAPAVAAVPNAQAGDRLNRGNIG